MNSREDVLTFVKFTDVEPLDIEYHDNKDHIHEWIGKSLWCYSCRVVFVAPPIG